MITIKEAGWYRETDDGVELVATNADELVEYLDDEGSLRDLVVEYICDNYDMEDFVENAFIHEGLYMTSQDMLEDFKHHELKEGECYNGARDWLDWYEEGDTIEEEGDEPEEEDN